MQQAISAECRAAIIDAAITAPTAGCQSLYTLLDITDQEIKDRLAVLCDNQPFIAKAPLVIVFLADCQRWLDAYEYAGVQARKPGVGDLTLAIADAVIAAQNSVVAAESLGICSCYIGDITENEEEVRELLALDDYVYPAALLVYGYPSESHARRKKPARFNKDYLVQKNQYRRFSKQEHEAMFDKRGDLQHGQTFEHYIEKFCTRKYMSDFSLEMQRSVQKYVDRFE
jgi:nitroreductase